MGTFSIWHWAIVLACLALYIVPIVAADQYKCLARRPYALRTVGFFVAIVVISAIASGIGNGAVAIGIIPGGVLAVFMVLWSVHRAQDIGWSKWSCLLFLIPFVALIFWLVLLFKPGKRGIEQGAPATSEPAPRFSLHPEGQDPANSSPMSDVAHESVSQTTLDPSSGYIGAHWRGEYSLVRSYWVNGVLLSVLLYASLFVLEEPLSRSSLSIQTGAILGLLLFAVLTVITVWQLVGIWRSATNTLAQTGRALWPGVAKFFVLLGLLNGTFQVTTGVRDLFEVLGTLTDPTIAEYMIERRADTDLILTGAINEKSAREIIHALQDPSITILRVNSHGGLIEPAIQLGRYIRENDVMVMAEEQCISACVIVLAASPSAAIYPGTTVMFHRAEPLVEFSNPDLRRETALHLVEAEEIYREFGVADWAIETAARQQYWTPTMNQLIRMDLVSFIYDLDQQRFVLANDYCTDHPSQCSGLDISQSDAPGDYYVREGDIRLGDGEYEEALESFNKALDEMPDNRGALMGRALVFTQSERYDEAIAEYDHLIRFLEDTLEQDDITGKGVLAAAYANRGIVYDRQGNYEAALASYISALKTDEDSVSGPDVVHKILYGSDDVSNVRKRAQYIYEQLQLPEDERVLRGSERGAQ